MLLRAAIPRTTGRNIAVVVVFFMNAAHSAATIIIIAAMRNSLLPAIPCKRRPTDVNHAGLGQPASENEQPGNRDDDVVAEPCKRFGRRERAGDNQQEHENQRNDVNRNPLGRKENESNEQQREDDSDLGSHILSWALLTITVMKCPCHSYHHKMETWFLRVSKV